MNLDKVKAPQGMFIGDPDGAFGCPGNKIRGTVSVSNSTGAGASGDLEVENNSVRGSVLLSGSQLQVNGDSIKGSLSCTNGSTILPPEDDDAPGNKIGGFNDCY